MTWVQWLAIVVYIIGFLVVFVSQFNLLVGEDVDRNDFFTAGVGFLVLFLIAAVWPVMAAASPLLLILWGIGRLVKLFR